MTYNLILDTIIIQECKPIEQALSEDVTNNKTKQPDMPEKKPKKKTVSKAVPKKSPAPKPEVIEGEMVEKPKYVLKFTTKRDKDKLTIGQLLELNKQDRTLLTPAQLKQVQELNEMLIEVATRITANYDFAKIARSIQSIQTFPFHSIAQQAQDAIIKAGMFNTNLTIPLQQLVKTQQSLMTTNTIFSQALLDAVSAIGITRNLFAGITEAHAKIIKSLQIDIPSLGSGLARISSTETIDLDVTEVTEQDGHIEISSSTSQIFTVSDFVLVRKADLTMLINEFRNERNERLEQRSEVSEIKQLIQSGIKEGLTRIAYADVSFKRQASSLIMKGFEIVIARSSKQAQLCEVFFRSAENFKKQWSVEDFIEEAYGEMLSKENPEIKWIKLLRGYIFQLNRNILGSTKGQFDEFFVLLDSKIYINQKYLSNL